jgi:hypothetical protein
VRAAWGPEGGPDASAPHHTGQVRVQCMVQSRRRWTSASSSSVPGRRREGGVGCVGDGGSVGRGGDARHGGGVGSGGEGRLGGGKVVRGEVGAGGAGCWLGGVRECWGGDAEACNGAGSRRRAGSRRAGWRTWGAGGPG